MSLQDIRDQEVAIALLKRMLERDRVPNALLFWGPPGVGKKMTALEMAKALNCEEEALDACGRCLSCRKVDSGNHPDVRVVAPSKRSRVIDLETINEINEMAALRPYQARWRVFVLVDAERMNVYAQNRFLKTLEEPPGPSLFILTTEYPRVLLPTIRSRCQIVRFRSLRPETLRDILKNLRDLPDETATSIAALAQGQVSRALDLVDSERRTIALAVRERLAEGRDPLALAEEFTSTLKDQRKAIEAEVENEAEGYEPGALSKAERDRMKEDKLALADALARRDILEYLYLLETWYRDELVFAATGDAGRVLNLDQLDALAAARSSGPAEKIEAIERARGYLDRYINEERVFRDLFFALAAP